MGQNVANITKSEAQKVKSAPLGRVLGTRVVRAQADAPDPVERAGLDEHPVTRAQQEVPEVVVLTELVRVAGDDDAVAVLIR